MASWSCGFQSNHRSSPSAPKILSVADGGDHERLQMTDADRITLYETALVECFDAAIPQAMPWMGTFSEKAEYAARTLATDIRGLMRLHAYQRQQNERLQISSEEPFTLRSPLKLIPPKDIQLIATPEALLDVIDRRVSSSTIEYDGEHQKFCFNLEAL